MDGANSYANRGRLNTIAFLNSISRDIYPNNKNTVHEFLQTYVSPLNPFSKTRNNQSSGDRQGCESCISENFET